MPHGSREFLHQITRKFVFSKQLAVNQLNFSFQNEDLKKIYARNDSKQETSLIGPFKRKNYQNATLEAINLKLSCNFRDNYFLTSFRYLINKRIFHSVNYNRKGNLNIFTVFFNKNSKLQF